MILVPDEKTYSLSIYLHKTSITNFEECLKEEAFQEDNNIEQFNVSQSRIGARGKIFVSHSDPTAPKWQGDINRFTESNIELADSITNRAVVILKVDQNFMSITYGYGKFMLNEESIVRDFGIKVAANLIDPTQIRSLNTMNIEDIIINVQRQSSLNSDKSQLGIDEYKDILKEVAGSPNRRQGSVAPKFLVGTDSLKATKKMNLEEIISDLRYYKDCYSRNSYRDNGFDWLDNIQRIKDSNLLEELYSQLENSILTGNDELHIGANRPIDWSSLDGFFITGIGNKLEEIGFDIDLNSEEYFQYIRDRQSENVIDKLKRDKLIVSYNQREEIQTLANIYNSILYECELDETKYLLSHGEWFKINQDYYESITERINDIEIEEEIEFINYDENRAVDFSDGKYGEGRYNNDLANTNDNYFLMDQRNFQAAIPGNNPIEPCDIFTKDKELIHVKRYNGSSSLSHLLAQGIVSANLLTNTEFRNHINNIANEDLITDNDSLSAFKVVFAVVHKDSEKTAHNMFPFFTMVNLVQTTNQLTRMQIPFSLKKIDVIQPV